MCSSNKRSEKTTHPHRHEVHLQAGEKALKGSSEGNFSCSEKEIIFWHIPVDSAAAGHLSATFLIVACKCSLDTLFKSIARQTCATRHTWRWWMSSDISTGFNIPTWRAIYSAAEFTVLQFYLFATSVAVCTVHMKLSVTQTHPCLLIDAQLYHISVYPDAVVSYTSEEKHLLWQEPPGLWYCISQLQGALRVNLFLRAFPHSTFANCTSDRWCLT